jgi:c-di-GMP-binding flagellar brake protein YcgR
MKRLTVDKEVALTVGDVTIDCHVARVDGGEAALAPLHPDDGNLLPAASAGASIVFKHDGRLVMLRGAMYRATGADDLRFAETTARSVAHVVGEQRRKAARLPITLPATIRQLDEDGMPFGEERQLVTRDLSIGGFAVGTGVGGFPVGALVQFALVLTNGTMIDGTARVVRAASEMSGLRFEKLEPAQRVRLAGFLAGRQTSRGPRPARVGAAAPR